MDYIMEKPVKTRDFPTNQSNTINSFTLTNERKLFYLFFWKSEINKKLS